MLVRETLPDSVLDRADEIELVDLPVNELLSRLNEGKVYIPDPAQRAMASFFRAGQSHCSSGNGAAADGGSRRRANANLSPRPRDSTDMAGHGEVDCLHRSQSVLRETHPCREAYGRAASCRVDRCFCRNAIIRKRAGGCARPSPVSYGWRNNWEPRQSR